MLAPVRSLACRRAVGWTTTARALKLGGLATLCADTEVDSLPAHLGSLCLLRRSRRQRSEEQPDQYDKGTRDDVSNYIGRDGSGHRRSANVNDEWQ